MSTRDFSLWVGSPGGSYSQSGVCPPLCVSVLLLAQRLRRIHTSYRESGFLEEEEGWCRSECVADALCYGGPLLFICI